MYSSIGTGRSIAATIRKDVLFCSWQELYCHVLKIFSVKSCVGATPTLMANSVVDWRCLGQPAGPCGHGSDDAQTTCSGVRGRVWAIYHGARSLCWLDESVAFVSTDSSSSNSSSKTLTKPRPTIVHAASSLTFGAVVLGSGEVELCGLFGTHFRTSIKPTTASHSDLQNRDVDKSQTVVFAVPPKPAVVATKGRAPMLQRVTPSLVRDTFRYVACGRAHVAAVTLAGHCFCFGDNTHGQLGTLVVSPYTTCISIGATGSSAGWYSLVITHGVSWFFCSVLCFLCRTRL